PGTGAVGPPGRVGNCMSEGTLHPADAERTDVLKEAERFGNDLADDLARAGRTSADRVNLLLRVATHMIGNIPYQEERIGLAAIAFGVEPGQRIRDSLGMR